MLTASLSAVGFLVAASTLDDQVYVVSGVCWPWVQDRSTHAYWHPVIKTAEAQLIFQTPISLDDWELAILTHFCADIACICLRVFAVIGMM